MDKWCVHVQSIMSWCMLNDECLWTPSIVFNVLEWGGRGTDGVDASDSCWRCMTDSTGPSPLHDSDRRHIWDGACSNQEQTFPLTFLLLLWPSHASFHSAFPPIINDRQGLIHSFCNDTLNDNLYAYIFKILPFTF